MMTITATLTTLPRQCGYAAMHSTDDDQVDAILAHVQAAGRWDMPPVLVVEDIGNGATVLDGHHRMAAWDELDDHEWGWEIDAKTMSAYVVSMADYERLLDEEFGGDAPRRLADVRACIRCGDGDGNSICGHGE